MIHRWEAGEKQEKQRRDPIQKGQRGTHRAPHANQEHYEDGNSEGCRLPVGTVSRDILGCRLGTHSSKGFPSGSPCRCKAWEDPHIPGSEEGTPRAFSSTPFRCSCSGGDPAVSHPSAHIWWLGS